MLRRWSALGSDSPRCRVSLSAVCRGTDDDAGRSEPGVECFRGFVDYQLVRSLSKGSICKVI